MNLITIIVYLIIGFYLISKLNKKNKNNKVIGIYSGITFGIILYYFIIPIIIMIKSSELEKKYPELSQYLMNKSIGEMIFVAILVLIGFFVFDCAYNQSNRNVKEKKIEYNIKRTMKISKIVGYTCLIVGGISLLLFLNAFGGIKQAFSYAEIARSFNTNLSDFISGNSAILIIPSRLVTVAPFAFFILINEKTFENKYIYKLAFIISFILSIMYYIFNAGRAPLICFLLSFGLVFLYKYVKKPWKYILILCIIAMPILEILDSFSLYLQNGEWYETEINYIKNIYEFSFPYKNILNMGDIADIYGIRYGKDFVTSILGLIPGLNFEASYEPTSMFFGGMNWKLIGGIPNDIVTFSFVEFGYLGIPIFFAIIGYISGKLDLIMRKMPINTQQKLISSTLAIHTFMLVPNADFIAFVRGGFIIIFLSLILLCCYTRRK